jgi:phage terminase large subunit-like protein
MIKTFKHLIEDDQYYFDSERATKVIRFVEGFCKLSEPRGKQFVLLPWQKQVILDVFGWYSKTTGERRFVYVYIEIPRKNGKTFFLAAILLWLLMGETKGAEVYASACTKDQSGLLYKSVTQMIQQSKFLSERLEVVPYKKEIHYRNGDGMLKALSGESVGSHGKYPTAVCCDELHEWNSERAESLYEALTSGFGNRVSPLVLHITTAGYGSQPTLAKRLHEKALLFEKGECEDPTFYGVVYGAEPTDDWRAETTWQKANPSWELVKKNLAREFLLAATEPTEENKFKRLYLNIWTQQQTRWLDMVAWQNCVRPLKYDDLKGRDVIVSLDLSSSYDLTAVDLIFPMEDGIWKVITKNYMPSQQIDKRTKEDGIPYRKWQQLGYITATDGISKGITIDYPTITEDIKKIAEENNVITVGYDPSQAVQVVPYLEAIGIHCTNINPRYSEMYPGAKELERRITAKQIEFEDNPCLYWQAGNVEIIWETDGTRFRPVKPNAKGYYAGSAKYKVDAITALVIGCQSTLLAIGANAREATKKKAVKPTVFYM